MRCWQLLSQAPTAQRQCVWQAGYATIRAGGMCTCMQRPSSLQHLDTGRLTSAHLDAISTSTWWYQHMENLSACWVQTLTLGSVLVLYQQPRVVMVPTLLSLTACCVTSKGKAALIARFMGPTRGPSGADRAQVGPMFAPWTLLSVWHYDDSWFWVFQWYEHEDIMIWNRFPHYPYFMRGIHQSSMWCNYLSIH